MNGITLQNPDVTPVVFTTPPEYDIAGHVVHQKIDIEVQYPDHSIRKDSPLFLRSRKQLLVKKNTPCYVCGITYAKGGAMEAHHCCVEWAASNGIDWNKVKADTLYNPHFGNVSQAQFDWDAVAKDSTLFVDSIYNLMSLCTEHHRSTRYGIHFIPYPIWVLQKWPLTGFEFIPRTPKE